MNAVSALTTHNDKNMKKIPSIAGAGQALKKPLLIMKLTLILTVCCVLQSFSKNLEGQTITLKVQDTEIAKVLSAIEKQGSFRFLYNSRLKDLRNKVNATFNEADISLVLETLFSGTDLTFKRLENNLIAIRSEDPEEQENRVSGQITNESGEPISGVSISIKGTARGTVTDNNGSFSLVVPNNAILVISAIGYLSQEIAVANQTLINVRLVQSTQKMDEVIVVGYGSQRRRSVTGAISRVNGEDIRKQPLLTPVQGIQGLAPGIQVTGTSQPGTQPRVAIRGLNTILTNENPLYVVDGVLTEDITNINNADVLSVDVLKDGAAAIYGSRAANGVILITTRRGKSGKPNVSFNTYVGFRQLTNIVKMADRNLYLEYNNEARNYDGNPPLTTFDATANTDWFKEISRKGGLQNYDLNLTGGSDNVTYLFSAGYLKDKGVLLGANYERITLRSNNEYKVSKFLKFGNVINVNIVNSTNKPNGVFTDAYRASPAAPVKGPNGNYGFQPGLSAAGNPVANLELTNDFTKSQRYQGNLYGELTIIKGLTFRSAWGFDRLNSNNIDYRPTYNYGTFVQSVSQLFVSEANRFYWVWDNILNYKKTFGSEHSVDLTLGHTAERDRGRSLRLRATNVPPERNLWYINQGDPNITFVANGTGGNLLQRKSIFGRANYSYADKYNLGVVLRRDGSSAFPENQKSGTFYSVAASWVISEEEFMKQFEAFDYLKLRGGYAKLGNDGISRIFNNELATLTSVTITDPYGFPNGLVSGITFDQIKDALATWETTKSIDAGIEFGLLNRRLTGEVSYYNKLTEAYIRVPTPPIIDPDGILSQAADVRNKGFEFALNWTDKPNKEFSYRIGANATANKNNVEKVRGGIDLKEGGLGNGEVTTSTVEGRPIGSFWVYEVTGVFQTQAEIDAAPHVTGTRPGDFRFADLNKDNTIDERDRVFVGSYQPKFYYGINAGVNWKQFDFSIDCYGNAGNKVYNGKKAVRFGNENIEASRAGRWRASATSNTEYRASNEIPKPSTYFIESGSFFRINNITLGYSLPASLIGKAMMSSARFFVSAQNPVIIKKFSGFTPELPGSNALNSGIELGIYPTAATYMVGVNINFK
jgi:TonB-linked SusC/RagA family outer membrane protein